jgi:L-fucose mutarotase/ribose pyranase (RbsD/FucU family)
MTVAPAIIKADWKQRLKGLLPLLGHRNWIVVADSAYPAQSKPGIETIVSGAGLLDVARRLFDAIAGSKHVRANIYLDQELQFVAETDAPGISRYRKQLAQMIKSAKTTALPHEQIIAKLDRSAQTFRVLIIKTEMTIPYTSIFFELDCAYWSADAERRLRASIAAPDSK